MAAVAYAVTGDCALSEDVTQETFLAAWQRLKDLRDPEKLRPWLCSIARNAAHRFGRKSGNDPLNRAEPLEAGALQATHAPTPAEQASTAEQQRIVWDAIGRMPENYRMPLVMYYREGQSATDVATALELTEDAVRQRLSRARSMLKDEVSSMVENSITITRPSPLLVTGIMAAIAGGTLHASAASATAAAVVKVGTGAAGAASVGPVSAAALGTFLGPVVGLGGAIWGCMGSLHAAKSQAERQLVWQSIRSIFLFLIIAGGLQALTIYAGVHHWVSRSTAFVLGGALLTLYVSSLVIMILHFNHRSRELMRLRPDYKELSQSQRFIRQHEIVRSTSIGNLIGGYCGGTLGCFAWILVEAALQRDTGAFIATILVALCIATITVRGMRRTPQNYLLHIARMITCISAGYIAASAYWWMHGSRLVVACGNNWTTSSPWLPAGIASLMLPFAVGLYLRHRYIAGVIEEQGGSF